MRGLVLAATLALVAVVLVGRADAQPQGVREVKIEEIRDAKDLRRPVPAPAAAVAQAEKPGAAKDRDKTEGSGTGMALVFWAFALGTVGGAIFVITRRNLIAAVMGMVGTFFAVAGLYMMLYASFLAVIQVLVYAGAIMVLFVFVVMVLNKPEDEPWGLVGIPGKVLAGLAMLYLTFRLGQTLWAVEPPKAQLAAPAPIDVDPRGPREVRVGDTVRLEANVDLAEWGSTKAVGDTLFKEYLFPFEAVSILLLVAVVGAIAVARPFQDEDEDEKAGETGTPEGSAS